MGGVVQAISKAVSDVGHAVENVGKFVGHTVENVARAVKDDPLKAIATVAVVVFAPELAAFAFPEIVAAEAVAAGVTAAELTAATSATIAGVQAGGFALVSATDVIAHGGSVEDALKAAAISGGSSWLASSNIVTNYLTEAGANATVSQVASGAIRGAISAAAQGKDIATGAGLGALSSATAVAVKDFGVTDALKESLGVTAGNVASGTVTGALSSGLKALVQGKDVSIAAESGAANALLGSATGYLGKQFDNFSSTSKTALSDFWNSNVSPIVDQLKNSESDLSTQRDTLSGTNDQLTALQDQYKSASADLQAAADAYNVFSPDYKAASEALNSSVSSFNNLQADYQAKVADAQAAADAYNAKIKEQNDLYDQYVAAKDANNIDEANRLADQVDAVNKQLPDLRTVFDNKNAIATQASDVLTNAYSDYQTKNDAYNSAKDQATKLYDTYNSAKTTVDNINTEGQKLQTTVSDQVSQYNQAQQAYTEQIAKLNDVTNQVDKQAAGLQQFEQANPDPTPQQISGFLATQQGGSEYTREERQAAESATAENPWAQQAALGIQRFDDGSSLQVFDDGSKIVTDADGNVTTYNENGAAYSSELGAIGAPVLQPDGTYKTTFDDGSYIISEEPGGPPVETYDTEGNPYEPGSNPDLKASMMNLSISGGLKALLSLGSTPTRANVLQTARQQAVSKQKAATQAEIDKSKTLVKTTGPSEKEKALGLTAPTLSGAAGAAGAAGENVSDIAGTPENKQAADPLGFIQQGKQIYTAIPGLAAPINSDRQTTNIDPLQNLIDPATGQPVKQEQDQANQKGRDELDPFSIYSGNDNPSVAGAAGGSVPGGLQFLSEGGMNAVRGSGDGISDSIHALLSDGEYVIPARVVSELGNGSSDAGAKKLDQFVASVGSRRKKLNNIAEDGGDYLGGLA